MGFFTERCPNCGKAVSKNADFCNDCGCPSASSWATCNRCGSSVGSDSEFCWKCGDAQDLDARRRIYYDRWQRSTGDFAVRVELVIPDQTLHHGLQVDEGTLALIFQNGEFEGTLFPGYTQFDSFIKRFLKIEGGGTSHAILLDTRSAEIDFYLDKINTKDGVPVDVRARALFQVTEPKLFVDRFLTGRSTFTQQDLSDEFHGEVRTAVQERIGGKTMQELLDTGDIRELIEQAVKEKLGKAFTGAGLKCDGIRLADMSGEVVDTLREKMAEFQEKTLERELDSRLRDALRKEKVDLFRDEHDLNEHFEKVTHELGLKSDGREQQKKVFLQDAEKELQRAGMQLDWSIRIEQVGYELEEKKIRGEADREESVKNLDADLVEGVKRGDHQRGQEQAQATSDLEVAKQGIEALKLVKQAKNEANLLDEQLKIDVEKQLLEMRGGADMQALLATLSGEQADRLMKLTEMKMREGMTSEQSLAFIAEQAPENFGPAVAEALKAKFGQGNSPEETEKG